MNANQSLALFNVCMTACSFLSMLLGYRAIRHKKVRTHSRFMKLSYVLSFIFMITFVLRYSLYGSTSYVSTHSSRYLFNFLFYTHEPLAVINIPLVTLALITALRKKFRSHREIAKTAFLVWCYVSVTGMTIAIFLYLLQ